MEQWLQAYDSCRLMALNLYSIVDNPFTKEANINYDKLYEISYMQQRLADDLVDLEIEHIERIINKIKADPEPDSVKQTELDLWNKIMTTAKSGRRTGCGFTALGDCLAALNVKYDSEAGLEIIRQICATKMRAELDCTIDLSILRGSFEGWDISKEYPIDKDGKDFSHGNNFYENIWYEFPDQVERMQQYGRRNISWSTVAPTGTVSIMTQTSSGLEPLFQPFYIRRTKVNAADKDVRVDFTDENGDKWTEHPILHPKFREWIKTNYSEDEWGSNIEGYGKDVLEGFFKKSPWHQSCANDIDWTKRVEIQSIIQRYTTNAISSTINLPSIVTKEEVANIYWKAYELGLKGVTVYRDGCRTGVLITETNTKEVAFSYKDAVKRPKTLAADGYITVVKGVPYIVMIGLLEGNPYEVFACENQWDLPKNFACAITKVNKSNYQIDIKDILKIDKFTGNMTDEEAAITRLISTSLRHGTSVEHIVNQLNKTHGSLVGFSKSISRVLSKYVASKETGEACPECNSPLRKEEGCTKCDNCGYSKC